MNYRKGSMAAADAKAEKRFLIAFTIVFAIIFSMVYFNFPHTFLHDWHQKASKFWSVTGVVLFIGATGFMWFGKDLTWGEKGGKEYGIICVILLALAILCGCGWNFDLK